MPSIAPTRIRTKIRSKLRKKNSLARSTSRVWTTGTSGLDFFLDRARLPNWGTPSRRAISEPGYTGGAGVVARQAPLGLAGSRCAAIDDRRTGPAGAAAWYP